MFFSLGNHIGDAENIWKTFLWSDETLSEPCELNLKLFVDKNPQTNNANH